MPVLERLEPELLRPDVLKHRDRRLAARLLLVEAERQGEQLRAQVALQVDEHAAAGLLDGKRVATHWRAVPWRSSGNPAAISILAKISGRP